MATHSISYPILLLHHENLPNVDPLKPHFYIVKLGFTGVYIIFLISTQKHRFWVLVPTIYVLSRNMKNIRNFCLKFLRFSVVKLSVYLNRHVFVMPLWSSALKLTKLLSVLFLCIMMSCSDSCIAVNFCC